MFVTRSDDDGLTWSEPEEITESVKEPSWSYLGTGPGHGIQLGSGRLLIPCWSDGSPGPATWRDPPARVEPGPVVVTPSSATTAGGPGSVGRR